MFTQSKEEINRVNRKSDTILSSNLKMLLKYKFSNLTNLHNSPFYRGVKLWNKLPDKIQKFTEKSEFKQMVKNLDV